MKFTASQIDLTLELCGKADEQGKKETKIFYPHKSINADFADEIIRQTEIYVKAQQDLPSSEQDKVFVGNLKFLSWMYKDIDVAWVRSNFNALEINNIKDWAFQGLMGIKKDEES